MRILFDGITGETKYEEIKRNFKTTYRKLLHRHLCLEQDSQGSSAAPLITN